MFLLKKIVKVIFSLFIGLVVFILVVNFLNLNETKYKCTGTIKNDSQTIPLKLYAIFTNYIPLSDAPDGMIEYETPKKHYGFYYFWKRSGRYIDIYAEDNKKSYVGQYSKISNTLSFKTDYGFFDGQCVNMD